LVGHEETGALRGLGDPGQRGSGACLPCGHASPPL